MFELIVQACHHPLALTRKPHTLSQVLSAPAIAPVTTLLECARRADGGAAIIVASASFIQRNKLSGPGVVVVGMGESSGPLRPPTIICEDMFSCEEAARLAMQQAQLAPSDIDWWGLYDCFPICFIRAGRYHRMFIMCWAIVYVCHRSCFERDKCPSLRHSCRQWRLLALPKRARVACGWNSRSPFLRQPCEKGAVPPAWCPSTRMVRVIIKFYTYVYLYLVDDINGRVCVGVCLCV